MGILDVPGVSLGAFDDLEGRVTDLEAAPPGGGATTLDGLTDVTISSPSQGQQLVYDGTSGQWEQQPRQVFYVSDYGAVADGVTDDGTAIRAALSAAWSAGGIVQLMPGIHYLGSSSGGYLAPWASFTEKHVTIRGQGRHATILKMSTSCRTIVGPQHGYAAGRVYKNLTLEDFTVDVNNITASTSANYGVIIHFGGRCSVENLRVRRVDTINVGTLVSSGSERRNIDITIFSSGYTDPLGPFYIKDIKIEDCYFGRSGGGGNYGVIIQGYASNNGNALDMAAIPDPGGMSQCELDNIHFTRLKYNSGGVVPGGVQAYSSTGFMAGGNGLGKTLRITDCIAMNSCDDGFEVNSWYDAVIRGCVTYNCPQEGFYFVNLGGMPQPEKQRIQVINCTTIWDDSMGASTTLAGFRAAYKRTSPHGTLEFINCASVGSAPDNYSGQRLDIVTDFRKVVIRDFTYSANRTHTWTTNSQTQSHVPIRLGNPCGRGVMEIDGLHIDIPLTLNRAGFSSSTFTMDTVQIDVASDLTLKARDIDFRINLRLGTSGDTPAGWGTMRIIGFNMAPSSSAGDAAYNTETFNAGTLYNGYVFDAGASTDVTATSTGAQFSTSPFTERRWRNIYGTGNYPGFGPHTDLAYRVGFLTPSSATAGFKAGAGIKGQVGATVLDPLERQIESYVVYDGTNWLLCVDKADYVAGTRSSLLGSIVGGGSVGQVIATDSAAIASAGGTAGNYSDRGVRLTALSTGTTYYVRGLVRDNVVQGDVFSVVPNNANLSGGTNAGTTGAVTMTAADALLFGDPRQGWPTNVFVAATSTSRLATNCLTRMHVIRGHIQGVTFPHRNIPAKQAYLINSAQDDTLLRYALNVQADVSRVDTSILSNFANATAIQKKGLRLMPGSRMSDGQYIDTVTHPDMVGGSVVGGNTGTSKTVDVGNAGYWMATYTLTGNVTFTLANVPKGGTIDLLLTQDGTGSRTVAFTPPAGGTVKFAGGAVGMTAAAGAVDLITLTTLDGLNFLVSGAHDIK